MTTSFTFADVKMHKERGDCWVIINGKVYDVSQFLEKHPGGDLVLLAATGKDASDDFEDIGHSDGARELMAQFVIGDIEITTLPLKSHENDSLIAEHSSSEMLIRVLQFLIPLTFLALALCVRFLSNDPKSTPSS